MEDGRKKTSKAENKFYLLAIYGPYRGEQYALDKEEIRIGRSQELNDIVIQKTKNGCMDSSISRLHAIINNKEGRFYINDKQSKTGTYVNQYKLDSEEEIELIENDEIEIVSNCKSTIFRFVSCNHLDFSFPKKAGVWWIRMPLFRNIWTISGLIMKKSSSF